MFQVGFPAKKEADLGFMSNEQGCALCLADILVFNWDNGRDVCMDVNGVSPFTRGGSRTFQSGLALSNAITRKNKKYPEKWLSHGYGLVPRLLPRLTNLGMTW